MTAISMIKLLVNYTVFIKSDISWIITNSVAKLPDITMQTISIIRVITISNNCTHSCCNRYFCR